MSHAPDSITLAAHAKINLALAVGTPQPPKGYHPIASWMVAIDLHDDLSLRALPPGSPSRHTIAWAADAPRPTPIDWPIENDLAVRAHRLLEEHTRRSLPLELSLTKRTPVGGGLGGGSSDAAAALLGINRLFSLGLDTATLTSLGTRLGSDIAFFIDSTSPASTPRPAMVTGFGDRIERLSPIAAPVLLLLPPFGCPTGPVYAAYDTSGPAPLREGEARDLAARSIAAGSIRSADLFNDLAAPAGIVQPRLNEWRNRIRTALGVEAHVTGSGSTMFILPSAPASPSSLQSLAHQVRALVPELITLPTRLL